MEQNNNGKFSIEQAAAFAGTPAGRQLLRLLRQKNTADLTKAMELASAGNTEAARHAVASLLEDPQIQSLLKQFGG